PWRRFRRWPDGRSALFDLDRREADATSIHHLVGPAEIGERAVLGHAHRVPGHEPFALEALRGFLRGTPIAEHQPRIADRNADTARLPEAYRSMLAEHRHPAAPLRMAERTSRGRA